MKDNIIDDTKMKDGTLVESEFVYEQETHLTVSKTSVFFAGDGFIVYGCKGEVVLRVDSYAQDARDSCELVLMDPNGRCLLTVRRKRPSLHQRWEGFVGERTDGQKHIFSVRRSSMIGRSTVTVEVLGDPGEEYQIEGSFLQRSCTIFDAEKKLVAEIKRKVDASTHTMLGKDVFALCVKPGFDAAFAMGLVLVLDQINADDQINVDDYGDDGVVVDPTADD
ncbi:protein LURP-one-related 5-like [Prunus avium]|uniref:Protein LURP-one-related 5-like n=1 Tax=Prunus avium TaxID=42229 RepID=A0A6P5TV78_PRUAV|nr:protein LURP-one-related 5-like [Prunus avium]